MSVLKLSTLQSEEPPDVSGLLRKLCISISRALSCFLKGPGYQLVKQRKDLSAAR